ncbi:MAG: hypothetical protein UU82_C0015G0006 [Candidatus Nomurabacteria bacterium GW2011_GWC2_41_8]|uniref:Uncharacterized protein n=3 Tax=Candidatus Nomuraibacteriota TaxID=1752729 RepID=A0A1F6YC48_9BACT|nr:MAG: hypothetical protein UU58_C0007G0006 [Candidatus Nomurabacteria bacterium GW2011_GWA2_41_25]KKS23971.1 MAG: hypothetical protein UU82_C0015G0006 [Candidatus Nomurabacteria bacterium GW2011_GWC2_41_8]OGI67556.1 MAG: hypothetical protein A2823_02915 [Candidatus Nomurabacteria bacterium RIFCSPHIGHO2_01_FULL_41_91]OGI80186.1 MAG: hypothetical protein A3D43_03150 [Candidatus Nomurabacteria bacterium RIFCSPHIGHO2_02_FULL_41_52]OGI85250.1 MAG: hypothetical protein A3F49_01010 [Candidatus Nomur
MGVEDFKLTPIKTDAGQKISALPQRGAETLAPELPEFMKNPFYQRFREVMAQAGSNPVLLGRTVREKFTNPAEWSEAHTFVQTVISELEKYKTSEVYMARQTGPAIIPLDQAANKIEELKRIERSLGSLLSGN